jgi:hypothetical protein
LVGDKNIAENVRDFLAGASLADVRDRLILPIGWDVNAPTQEGITALVARAVVALGREQQLTAPQSRMAIPNLLQRIFEKATARDDRWLDHDDLVDAFETATSIPVRINQLATLFTETTRALPHASDEAVLDPLPPLPPRFHYRPSVFVEMQLRLGNGGRLILTGSSLLATTDHLILMVRRRVADLWRSARTGSNHRSTSWATLHAQLLVDLRQLVADETITDAEARRRLAELIALNEQRRPSSRLRSRAIS